MAARSAPDIGRLPVRRPGGPADRQRHAGLPVYRFDSRLLLGSPLANGLERFNQPDQVDPGEYLVDVFVNGAFYSRKTVSFRRSGEHPVHACLDRDWLLRAGMRPESLVPDEEDGAACRPLALRIPGAGSVFDLSRLRLDLSCRRRRCGERHAARWRRRIWTPARSLPSSITTSMATVSAAAMSAATTIIWPPMPG